MAAFTTRPRWLNARSNVYDAWELRKDNEKGAGVYDWESFRVMQTQSGAAASVDVGKTGVGLMRAQVRGSSRDGQGVYSVDNIDTAAPLSSGFLAQLNVAVGNGDPTNPRLDQIVLQVEDSEHAGGNNQASIVCLPGTPNAATTLDTRTSAAALPASCILLADVLRPAASTTVVTANIRDRRPRYAEGDSGIAGASALSVVSAQPVLAAGIPKADRFLSTQATLSQTAALVYLPNRIKAATRLRWVYRHAGVAMVGNYNIAIYDASGRLKVETGSVAFTGALNTFQARSEPIAATDFEPGNYYVLYGHAFSAGQAAAVCGYYSASSTPPPATSQIVATGAGGVTAPTTILGFTDLIVGSGAEFCVPVIALTVG